jgi:hypothetical protein
VRQGLRSAASGAHVLTDIIDDFALPLGTFAEGWPPQPS